METERRTEPRLCRVSNSEVKTLNSTHNQAFLFFHCFITYTSFNLYIFPLVPSIKIPGHKNHIYAHIIFSLFIHFLNHFCVPILSLICEKTVSGNEFLFFPLMWFSFFFLLEYDMLYLYIRPYIYTHIYTHILFQQV